MGCVESLLSLSGNRFPFVEIDTYIKILEMIIRKQKISVLKKNERFTVIAIYYFGKIKTIAIKKKR